MNLFLLIILFSLLGGLFSLVGGVLLLAKGDLEKEFFIHLLAFAAGALLSAAFLDLFPEAVETGLHVQTIFMTALGGFIFSFLAEGAFLRFHHHDTHRLGAAPWMMIASDSAHNFLDGIAIAAAFFVNIPLGIVTAIAVAAHEIPQELGDFSIMMHAGWERRKILFWNIASSLFSTAGAVGAFFFRETIEPYVGYVLAATAGVFLYIAASDIVPELYHTSRRDKLSHVTVLFVLGILVVGIVVHFADSVLSV
jgi:zinc and cadmium transporter